MTTYTDALRARQHDWLARQCPQRFQHTTIPDGHRTVVDAWLNEPAGSLILAGSTGTGKTGAAFAAMRALIDRGLTVSYITASALADSYRPSTTTARPRSVATADVLLVDDLGAEKRSEWWQEQLGRLLNDRWANRRTEIVTTNLSPAELRAHIGDAAASRLLDCATILEFGGKDHRIARRPTPVGTTGPT